jgi:hypothetical protein
VFESVLRLRPVAESFDRYMEWTERHRKQLSFAQPAPFRRLMYFAWRRPLAGTVAQGVCFGVGMFPIALLLTWSLQAAWQLSVAVAVLFVIGLYPSNRWKHNRPPERFLLESHDRH